MFYHLRSFPGVRRRQTTILLRRTVASCLSGIRSVPGKQYRLAASEILRSPYIGLTTGSGGGKLFDNFLLTHNIPIHQRINVDSTAVLLELINEGMGWAITRPAGIIQHWETIPNVKLAPMPKPLLSRELYLVSKKSFPFDLFRLIVESLVRITRERLAKRQLNLHLGWKGRYLHNRLR